VALVSNICVDVVAARRKGATRGICGQQQAPHLTRQSVDALDTLRTPQRLTDRGSVLNSILDSVGGDGRHCEWSCHGRQRVKRGVSPKSGTQSP